jgi:ABC-type antimicrobial peptide transport system permease subunit
MVLKSAAGLVCAGLAVGVPLAFAGRRFAASLIQNVPVEPAIPIALAAAAMIALAMIAAYVPARRAARVNPIEVLRSE